MTDKTGSVASIRSLWLHGQKIFRWQSVKILLDAIDALEKENKILREAVGK